MDKLVRYRQTIKKILLEYRDWAAGGKYILFELKYRMLLAMDFEINALMEVVGWRW